MEILNKVIVITGGSGGIGQAICKEFLKESPKAIILADISFKDLKFENSKLF